MRIFALYAKNSDVLPCRRRPCQGAMMCGDVMQGLPILIRLARQRADERRLQLARAERQTQLAAETLAAHDARMAQETEQARGQPVEMASWSDWSRVAAGQRRRLLRTVAALRQQEDTLRHALRDDFAGIKRLEIARDTAAEAARRQQARRAERMAEDAELRRPRPA
jgi:hypothetical protein